MDACAWIQSGNKTARGGRTCCILPTRPCALQWCMWITLERFSGGFPDFNRRRGRYIKEVQPHDARSIRIFQDRQLSCHKHVRATAVAHLRVATIFVAAHLTRTSPERTFGQQLQQPLQDLLRTLDACVGAGGGSADPARTSTEEAASTTPPGGVIEQHAAMEHSRVSRADLRAEPATVARKCGPAWPSRGLGPTWADHKSSWALPPEDLLEDEPDVLYQLAIPSEMTP
jgi:hypothetical protein